MSSDVDVVFCAPHIDEDIGLLRDLYLRLSTLGIITHVLREPRYPPLGRHSLNVQMSLTANDQPLSKLPQTILITWTKHSSSSNSLARTASTDESI
jgi:hypothetical protein